MLIANTSPWPPNTGGRQRTNLLYRALSCAGTVDLFLIAGEPDLTDDVMRVLRESYGLVGSVSPLATSQIGWWKYVRPAHPAFVNRAANVLQPSRRCALADPRLAGTLRRVADLNSYDVIVTRYLRSAVLTDVLGTKRVVVDVDDLESSVLSLRLDSGVDRPLRQAYLRRCLSRIRDIEHRQLALCRHAWVAKRSDMPGIGHDRCSVLPNIPFTAKGEVAPYDRPIPCAASGHTLLTVGMLNHAPNVQGIDAFLQRAWPAVRQAYPKAEYRIVGSRLEPATGERWAKVPGVTVVGFAPSLADEYALATTTICAIPWGGGTNIKVAESLAYGRPAVVTTAAHRGWSDIFPDGESVLVAEDDAALAAHAISLLSDPDRCRRMGEAGQAAARQHLSFDAFSEEVQRTLTTVLHGAQT
jgi:glycosyltransferase involved in cell wall biosynthesis